MKHFSTLFLQKRRFLLMIGKAQGSQSNTSIDIATRHTKRKLHRLYAQRNLNFLLRNHVVFLSKGRLSARRFCRKSLQAKNWDFDPFFGIFSAENWENSLVLSIGKGAGYRPQIGPRKIPVVPITTTADNIYPLKYILSK